MTERSRVQGSGRWVGDRGLTLSGLLARRCNFEGAESIAQRRSQKEQTEIVESVVVRKVPAREAAAGHAIDAESPGVSESELTT